MRIALIHNARLPVEGYGGTERLVWWLAKAYHQLGHEVELVCKPGSHCPFAKVKEWEDFTHPYLSNEVDFVHYFYTPSSKPPTPYLVTIGGNGIVGEKYHLNTVFVSQNMAHRHHAKAFVHNGIDPDDYIFQENKKDYFTFCAKASWKVKNVKGAIKIAKAAHKELHILGGTSFFSLPFSKIKWHGIQGGKFKAETLANASLLLFPVLWNEPFGIAIVEALISGTPVLGTPFGALPEIITDETGRICSSMEEMIDTVKNLPHWKAKFCREYALEKFHYKKMGEKYIGYYEKILNGQTLNPEVPFVDKNTGSLLPF